VGFRHEETQGLDYEDTGGLEVGWTGIVGSVPIAMTTFYVYVFFDTAVVGYQVGELVGL
jgi:hypothetical protein